MNTKWKAFNADSLNALCAAMLQIQGAADDNTSAVAELGGNFQNFTKLVNAAIKDMDALKQDKPRPVSVVIPANGWERDDTEEYPYYCDLLADGVTAADRAEVTFSPAGLRTAYLCGMCQTNETLEGKIRLRAAGEPEKDIPAEYWIEKGEE